MCVDNLNLKEINKAISDLKSKHDITVNNVSFIIVTYNNLEYIKVCIESIRRNNNNYEIIVIDNKSTDGTVKWLENQEDVKTIYNNEYKEIPKCYNMGLEMAKKDNDILFLNEDTILFCNSIFNMRMALYSSENIGCTGAVSNNSRYYQKMQGSFKEFDEYIKYAERNNVTDDSTYSERIKVDNFAMLIKRDVLSKIGYLDEKFIFANYEDDFCLRVVMDGYKLLFCQDAYIHNFGIVSINNKFGDYHNLLNNDTRYFINKWGFNMRYSSFIRYDIISLINDDINKPIKILEVGCACGTTLLEIKNKYKNAEIYGIELNENSAKIAKCFADVRAENIENAKLSYEEGFFDYIIFADVLEHLYDPELVLNNMKKYLKGQGHILTSIPNVMHCSVIKDLLQGNWTYMDSGILDKTHIRFFTYKEIIKLFIKAKYKIDSIGNINLKISDEDMELINTLTKISNSSDESQFIAYQYLVKVSKE